MSSSQRRDQASGSSSLRRPKPTSRRSNLDTNSLTPIWKNSPVTVEQQEQLDDYKEALQEKYPENWQEQPFDGQIAYKIGGGLPHGRLAIGNGAVNKATIIHAAKASGTRPATSRAFQNLMARYEESVANVGRLTEQNNTLVEKNAALTRDVKRNGRLLEGGTIDGSSRASANMDRENSDGH